MMIIVLIFLLLLNPESLDFKNYLLCLCVKIIYCDLRIQNNTLLLCLLKTLIGNQRKF